MGAGKNKGRIKRRGDREKSTEFAENCVGEKELRVIVQD
jgi:hypothetical protein